MSESNFEIEVNGEKKDIKMSFGLLNELCGMCGDVEDALLFGMNTELREEVLRLMLSSRDEQGRIKENINLNTLEVDPDAINELLDWAGGHVLDFFLKAAERAKTASLARKDRMEALQQSSSGGED